MTSMTAIRAGLATRLKTIDGLQVHATASSAINPPAAVIFPAAGTFLTYDQAMGGPSGGVDDVTMTITLLVSKAVDKVAQDKLDSYLANSGLLSVKAAVDGDIDLGGVASYAVVTSAGNYGPIIFGEGDAAITYFGCEFTVVIGAS